MASDTTIYLDNAATTRVAPEVQAAMEPFFCTHFGNAASKYYNLGRQALAAVETGRAQLADLLGAERPEEVAITSCATESNNWVLLGTLLTSKKKHVITSAIEHHAVLEPLEYLAEHHGVETTLLPVDATGLVSPEALREALREDTALVSIMHANNEVAALEPIRELAEIAHEKGILFHTDACQTVGKIPFTVQDLGVDLLSLSAHKFHGPKGIGALYIKRGTRLAPLLRGGGQEKRRRAGTSNVASIVGMGKAAELAGKRLAAGEDQARALVEHLWQGLQNAIPEIRRNGPPDQRIPTILSVCVTGAEGEAVLGYLDMYGISISSGSACTSGSLDPSHVLLALGLPHEVAHGSLRFSLSHETTEAEIDRVIEVVPQVVQRVRDMSPTWNG